MGLQRAMTVGTEDNFWWHDSSSHSHAKLQRFQCPSKPAPIRIGDSFSTPKMGFDIPAGDGRKRTEDNMDTIWNRRDIQSATHGTRIRRRERPSTISQTVSNSVVYTNEHQNRRLHWGLFLLCPILEIQHRPRGEEALYGEFGSRGRESR
jgi:hypothetical protein